MVVLTDDNEFLTIAEASNLLRVSRVTLHRWLKQGRLQAYHVGPRAVRIRRTDIAAVIAPHESMRSMVGRDSSELPIQAVIQPLTEEEKRSNLAALEGSRLLIQQMRARRGGQPFDESWPMIREAREERSRQI